MKISDIVGITLLSERVKEKLHNRDEKEFFKLVDKKSIKIVGAKPMIRMVGRFRLVLHNKKSTK